MAKQGPAVSVAVAALALAACGATDDAPKLVSPGNSTITFTVQHTRAGHPYTLQFMRVCLTSPGAITVTGARVLNPQGLVLRAVGVTTKEVGLARTSRSIWQSPPFRPGRQTVTTVCSKNFSATIGFELVRQTAKTGTGDAILGHLPRRTHNGDHDRPPASCALRPRG